MTDRRIDEETGVETTGHEWDGIEELNNPLPRWWLWTFYATVVFALIYVVLYPAWPLVDRATGGVLGWSTRDEVATDMAAVEASQAEMWDSLVSTDVHMLRDNEALNRFASQAGAALFRTNCSQCHGSGAAGAVGYPNLLDDDWLWGGRIEEIAVTIRHGIRNEEDPDARFSQMPAFGDFLGRGEIATLVAHVQSLPEGADPLAGPGGQLFGDNCASCHGDTATGDTEIGAPDLTDAIWLYGGDAETLTEVISRGPYGVMPPWGDRLGEARVRALAAYVHQLGGGEPEAERSDYSAEEQVGEGETPTPPEETEADPSDPGEVPFPGAGEEAPAE
ncbi:cytochrome-c oxidase, cbb3-type subunit III [Pseudoroseicyclus tamaricis]|uniref:Cbb3-type cytochrome c oxidase subunit n=1 Tax=Pseudoroseicyclus tamaricis TaxID=2705421 RepID=A0A6B2JSS5_9RHOB|nr:cytochrome-c oxidase, cbb3-type subunit III [Pseudoroseicyclus tamaricis]NDV01278.1 cytochrome-c oxidase, cbb3-type subunit III [Pseudoroseicyclus tamaricis]